MCDRLPTRSAKDFLWSQNCGIAFIELEEAHCVRLRDGPIVPIRSIIVKVEVEVPN